MVDRYDFGRRPYFANPAGERSILRGLEKVSEQFMQQSTFTGRDFPIVCVGGSAGGLDAYTRLLQQLPADTGVAIVIVNHRRKVSTRLHEILRRFTTMPVTLITEKLLIERNHVYIIPSQRDLHVFEGSFN